MKRFLFLLIPFVSLFISGCNTPYFTGDFEYTINNNSTKNISVIVNDTNATYTINANQSITITKNNHNELNLVGHPRVNMSKDVRVYTITDIPYRIITIWNPTTNPINLIELNGMIGDNFGDIITIPAEQTVITKLYTTNPSYIAKYNNGLNADVSLLSIN